MPGSMSRKPYKRPTAERDPKTRTVKIDWGLVDRYLSAGCSGVEIAGVIGISPSTLWDRCLKDNGMPFSYYMQEKKASGIGSLRLKQYELAMKGNVTMLIYLGKVYVGQREEMPDSAKLLSQINKVSEYIRRLEDDKSIEEGMGELCENTTFHSQEIELCENPPDVEDLSGH